MLLKNELLEELINLRSEIRNNDKDAVVCNDDALVEMVRKKPLKVNDFLAISGLEKNFNKLYAKQFLKIINNYRLKETKEVKVSKRAYKVLHNYKDRLTNISKNNPNLYMGRIEKVKSFDLATLLDDENLIEFLTNKRIKNYKFNLDKDTLFNNLTTLYRNANKDRSEEHTSELQSRPHLVCRLLLEKKK